jgi:hypothetical protein
MIIQIKPFRILCGTVADWEKAAYERGALASTLRRHSGASEASRAGWATRREKRDARSVVDAELDRTSEANHNQK